MQRTTQSWNDAKKQLAYYKELAEAFEKRNRKLDILNDNLYTRVYGLWTALFISLIFNIIQFFTSWWIC
jgi:hypothetical protein